MACGGLVQKYRKGASAIRSTTHQFVRYVIQFQKCWQPWNKNRSYQWNTHHSPQTHYTTHTHTHHALVWFCTPPSSHTSLHTKYTHPHLILPSNNAEIQVSHNGKKNVVGQHRVLQVPSLGYKPLQLAMTLKLTDKNLCTSFHCHYNPAFKPNLFQITHTTVNMQAALEYHKMPHRVSHQWSYNMYNIWVCHTHFYLMLNLNLPSNHLDPWAHSTGDSTFSCLRQITEEFFYWIPNLISALFLVVMKKSSYYILNLRQTKR